MAEAYRPKKKINPSEITGSPPSSELPPSGDLPLDVAALPGEAGENQTRLEDMAEIREMLRSESRETDPSGFDPMSMEGGIKTSGQMPQELQDAISRNRSGEAPLAQSMSNLPPEMRITGSSKLEELIAGIAKTSTYEKIVLPSLGKFYENGPSDGVLHIRPMTGEEEQILATPRFVRKGQAINMIFNKCIRESYDAATFLSEDRTYLLIYLRGISYTPEYEVEIKCPECDRKFPTIIDLNAIYVDECPADFTPASLKGVLPASGYNFTYRLSEGADEQRLSDYKDRKLKGGFDTANMLDDSLLYRNALLVNDIEGLTDKTEIQHLLKKLPIKDVAYLRNTVNTPPFGPDTDIPITCDSCLHDFEVDLPLEANFFFPQSRRTT